MAFGPRRRRRWGIPTVPITVRRELERTPEPPPRPEPTPTPTPRPIPLRTPTPAERFGQLTRPFERRAYSETLDMLENQRANWVTERQARTEAMQAGQEARAAESERASEYHKAQLNALGEAFAPHRASVTTVAALGFNPKYHDLPASELWEMARREEGRRNADEFGRTLMKMTPQEREVLGPLSAALIREDMDAETFQEIVDETQRGGEGLDRYAPEAQRKADRVIRSLYDEGLRGDVGVPFRPISGRRKPPPGVVAAPPRPTPYPPETSTALGAVKAGLSALGIPFQKEYEVISPRAKPIIEPIAATLAEGIIPDVPGGRLLRQAGVPVPQFPGREEAVDVARGIALEAGAQAALPSTLAPGIGVTKLPKVARGVKVAEEAISTAPEIVRGVEAVGRKPALYHGSPTGALHRAERDVPGYFFSSDPAVAEVFSKRVAGEGTVSRWELQLGTRLIEFDSPEYRAILAGEPVSDAGIVTLLKQRGYQGIHVPAGARHPQIAESRYTPLDRLETGADTYVIFDKSSVVAAVPEAAREVAPRFLGGPGEVVLARAPEVRPKFLGGEEPLFAPPPETAEARPAFLGAKEARPVRVEAPDVPLVPPEVARAEADLARDAAVKAGGGTDAFAAPLRPKEVVYAETLPTDHPILRAVAAKLGINPAAVAESPIARLTVMYARDRIAGEQLVDVAIQAAIDSHAVPVIGREALVVTRSGTLKGATALEEGASLHWNDVLSRPGAYKLNPRAEAAANDVRRLVEELEFLRVQAGLEPLATTGRHAAEEGWFYVPRKVKTIRGVEVRRPSNPSLQRHYETALEGTARDIDYESVRTTAVLHADQAFREIAGKRLEDMLELLQAEAMAKGERLFLVPKELIPQPVLQRLSDATLRRLSAEDAIRAERTAILQQRRAAAQEIVKGRLGIERARTAQERLLATGRAPARQKPLSLGVKIKAATEKLTAAQAKLAETRERALELPVIRSRDVTEGLSEGTRTELANALLDEARAKGAYSDELAAARQSTVAPGRLYGPAMPETISVGMWRNRFFPIEQIEQLRAGVDEFAKFEGKGFTGQVLKLGNTIRFLATFGDLAEPFIQGQGILAEKPFLWAKHAALHYLAVFDPTVQAREIRNHLATYQAMAQHGTPIGDPEFFAALREGQGFSPGALLKFLPKGEEIRRIAQQGGRQTFGRFQAAYNTGLGSSRRLLTDGLEDVLPDMAGRQQYIRNITGGLDSRALGVGPNQRALEGFWLALSPRLLRSTVAIAGMMMKPGTPQGRRAWLLAGKYAAGVTGIYVISGLALGKSWGEIRHGLNPLAGKAYLSHNINNDWVGVGGQIRALTQLAVHAAANWNNPKAFFELDLDNPLWRFWMFRGAPAVTTVGAAAEALGQGDVLPFEQVDGPIDFTKHLGKAMLPFTAQNWIEGVGPLGLAGGFFGLRTSAETPWETRNQLANQVAPGYDYDELTPNLQKQVNDALAPDVLNQIKETRQQRADAGDIRAKIFLELERRTDENIAQLQQVAAGVTADPPTATRADFRNARSAQDAEMRGARDFGNQLLDLDPEDRPEGDPSDPVLQQRQDLWDYFSIFERFANAVPGSPQEEEMFNAIDEFRDTLSPGREEALDNNIGVGRLDIPLEQEFRELRRNLRLSKYFRRSDDAWLDVVDANRHLDLPDTEDEYRQVLVNHYTGPHAHFGRLVPGHSRSLARVEAERHRLLKLADRRKEIRLREWERDNSDLVGPAEDWGYKTPSRRSVGIQEAAQP